jgi:signal transduction histidine kinase
MFKKIGLRSRILLMVFALVSLTIVGGLVSIWHTYMMDKLLENALDTDLPALISSQELRSSLVMQKGYVTYYFQDRDPTWLRELDKCHEEFKTWLQKARTFTNSRDETRTLNEIDTQYDRYAALRTKVIGLYTEGKEDEGLKLQRSVRTQLFEIIDLCRHFQKIHERSLDEARRNNQERMILVKELTMGGLVWALLLGSVLAYTLVRNVLAPIHRLARDSGDPDEPGEAGDDVRTLTTRFQTLMKDVEQTKSKLEWSRVHLQQAEKWALVGKLAAGVAHSVRNPLTSVKMRLFSMERTLKLDTSQQEDFEVISEEIRHIDSIVSNFLEFARPPKLKMRISSPSDAVDMAIQLLRHRLESYNVKVLIQREQPLPQISADPDQLKEVLVNLMVNSCEAMVNGGEIRIREETDLADSGDPVVVIRVSDTGPGIPESVRNKVFQPFFSTKGEGTGLGLSIATRIVEEHGGWLDYKAEEGQSGAFVITLPAREESSWAQSS